MILRKHLTYIKNRLRRGGAADKALPWLFPGFAPCKTSIRGILAGLRLYKQMYPESYEGIVTSRLNNRAYFLLVDCIHLGTAAKEVQLEFVALHLAAKKGASRV